MIRVVVVVTDSSNGRTVRYEADLADIDIMESHMTGELSLRPGPRAQRDLPATRSPWRQIVGQQEKGERHGRPHDHPPQ